MEELSQEQFMQELQKQITGDELLARGMAVAQRLLDLGLPQVQVTAVYDGQRQDNPSQKGLAQVGLKASIPITIVSLEILADVLESKVNEAMHAGAALVSPDGRPLRA